jgi:gluconokinase
MHAGIPLNDDDRKPWLEAIRAYMDEMTSGSRSLVVACSALKQRYRDVLRGPAGNAEFVYLKGDFELLQGRLSARKDHFFNPALLRSQFDALEEPTDAIVVDIALPPETLVQQATEQLQARAGHRPAAGRPSRLLLLAGRQLLQHGLHLAIAHAAHALLLLGRVDLLVRL